MKNLEYSFLRLAYERFLKSWLYVQMDARAAAYPQAHWSDKQNFISCYLEFGYRSHRTELSFGFGFDPVMFDRTRNGYFDIGRQEFLRTAAWGEVLRGGHPTAQGGEDLSSVSTVEYNLLGLEKSLQENSTLKLEWIVLF
jgi:hypothetical protein